MTVFQKWILGIVGVLSSAIVIYFIWQLSISNYPAAHNSKLDLESTASIGDFIGGVVGSLLSAAAIILLIGQNIYLSKEINENSLQRNSEYMMSFTKAALDNFKDILNDYELDLDLVSYLLDRLAKVENDDFFDRLDQEEVILYSQTFLLIIAISNEFNNTLNVIVESNVQFPTSINFKKALSTFILNNENVRKQQDLLDELSNVHLNKNFKSILANWMRLTIENSEINLEQLTASYEVMWANRVRLSKLIGNNFIELTVN